MALTADYRFNGNTNDLVGSNNGTLVNSPTVGPRMGIGGSYTFNGTNQYISHASAWQGAVSVYTFSMLFKRTSDTPSNQSIAGSNYYACIFRSATGLTEIRDYNGSVEPIVTYNVTKDKVHQIHSILSGGQLKMYVDGVFVGQAAMSGNTATTSRGNEIGSYWNTVLNFWFSGSIGTFKRYSQALSVADIKNDYMYHKGFI